MYPIVGLVVGCMRILEVCRIPSGRAGFGQGEYGSRLPFHLQGAQGVPGICLVAEAIAVAGRCLPVHAAKIVEGQEATCIDRYGHSYMQCTAEQQKQVLDLIAYRKNALTDASLSQGIEFFAFLRNLTADGFFTSAAGIKYLGYIGNTYLTAFTGCPPVPEA